MRPLPVAGAVLAAALVVACGAPAASEPSVPAFAPSASTAAAAPSAAAAASPSSTTGTPQADRLEAEIEVPGSPDWPRAAFDSMWVLAPDLPLHDPKTTPNLVRIDPATNEVVATIPVPDRLCQGFVPADDAIWVCAADALVRVDPTTNAITSTVPIKGALAFYQPAFGGGFVWALGSGGFNGDTVIRLDPSTESTTAFKMAGPIGAMAFGRDALWLTIPGEGSVIRVDPATGASSVVATGLPSPRAIAVGTDSLWVGLHGGQEDEAGPGDPQLARIDPVSGTVLAELEIGGSPQGGVELWAGDGIVLVRSTRPWLSTIEEATNTVVDTISAERAIQGPVTTGFGSIWTVDIERDSVFRVAR